MKRFLSLIVVLIVSLSFISAFAVGYAPIRFGKNSDTDAPAPTSPHDGTPWFEIKNTAEDRVKDEKHYYSVTVDEVECNSDISSDDADAWIINIDLTWDGMNGVPRTKTMLRMFGDDLAQTIFKDHTDLNITQLWLRWAVPYLYDDDGFIAKYKYELDGDDVYMTDSNGLLFNLPDDYK